MTVGSIPHLLSHAMGLTVKVSSKIQPNLLTGEPNPPWINRTVRSSHHLVISREVECWRRNLLYLPLSYRSKRV